MLRNTFRTLPGVGPAREQECWETGITDWKDYIAASEIRGIPRSKKLFHDAKLQKYRRALRNDCCSAFHDWPQRLMWRLFSSFKDGAVYLDIETDQYRNITLVAVHDGATRQYAQGQNLSRAVLQKELERADMLVTFNGSSFDLPLLEQRFNIRIDRPHLDLCSLAHRIDQKRPLSDIEDDIGIARESEANPVREWETYMHTKEKPEALLRYNAADAANLEPLAEHLVAKQRRELPVIPG